MGFLLGLIGLIILVPILFGIATAIFALVVGYYLLIGLGFLSLFAIGLIVHGLELDEPEPLLFGVALLGVLIFGIYRLAKKN